MLLTKSRISLISLGLILMMGFATFWGSKELRMSAYAMKRSRFLTLLAALAGLLIVVSTVYASVTVTPASGGTAISADDTGAGFTTLGAITIAEGVDSDFAISQSGNTLILTAPSGFEFNTAQVPDVTGNSADLSSLSISFPTATTLQLTFTTDGTADATDTVVIGGVTAIQVRPTSGTPLASGNILRTTANAGTGTIAGITLDTTNFGTLTEVHGAATALNVTTEPTASTVAGVAFAQQPIVEIQDQFGNTVTDSVLVVTATLTTGTGALTGIVTETAVAGEADFATNGMKIDLVGTNKVLTFAAPSMVSATSAAFTITFVPANLDPGLVVWNWDTSGTTVKVDFNINASLDGRIVEIAIFVEPTASTVPVHTQRLSSFGAFPTGQSLSFNFIHGTDLTGKTLGIHLLERVGDASVLVVASNGVGTVPTPIAAPLTPPTPTPSGVAPLPTVTPEPPPTGDFAPGSGLLLGLMLAGFLLIAAGGTYIAQHRRSELS